MANVSAEAAPHLKAFLDAADYFVGLEESGENTFTDPRGWEMLNLVGASSGQSWCAILVSACAVMAGVDWILIAPGTGVGGVTSNSVDYLDAEWIDGPYFTRGAVTPVPGDLISFVGSPASYYSGYEHGGHIGLVEYVDDDGVHTIEGNSSNMCRRNTYAFDNTNINGYCRPNWSALGDDVSQYLAAAGVSAVKGPLYANRNDRHDMTIRQVGYLDSSYELSNIKSNIGLSVINYTTLLGDLYDMFAAVTQDRVTVDTSQLTGNIKIAMDYFLGMGFSASSASAIVGCLKRYSNVSPSFSQNIAVVGNTQRRICGIAAWNNEKVTDIKTKLGYEWNIDLSGQLEYLLTELNQDYTDLVTIIKPMSLSIISVEQSAILFLRTYNNYFGEDSIPLVKEYATDIYTKLIITHSSTIGSVDNLRDEYGNLLSAQFSITIPSDVAQTGIIDDFTSYSAFYHVWNGSSPQRKLADMWAAMGCPCDKGVATIGGYYCVAVRPKFGSCGDVIVVTLEDGSAFAAIICDEKGEDAGSEWGHVKGNGRISLIEWERIVTYNGEVQTEGASAYIVDGHGFDDWLYQKVVNITNYGKYSDVRWT